MENTIKGSVAELVNDTTNPLPNMLGISQALDSVWNFCLHSSCQETLEYFSHPEEREMHI